MKRTDVWIGPPRRGAAGATLLACLSLCAGAPAAHAATEWFYERQPLAEGQVVEVPAIGKLKLNLRRPKLKGIALACAVNATEAVWDGPENGLDETRTISFACKGRCGQATITPNLPWDSTLEGTTFPLIDRWYGVSVEVSCGGESFGLFTGTLEPNLGDSDVDSPTHGDLDTNLLFRPKGSRLVGPNGSSLSFGGFLPLRTSEGHGVTGQLR
ncbi:MAG TPA: hypothetical protein VMP89_19760 [Solirubrobacteraceae bacterium]|nr:hypothetical protein [Solirubrobacteraceae bacterium]